MPSSDDKPIWEVWLSMFAFPSLTVADELGVFAALDEAPATAEELAGRLGFDLRGVRALLGVLAANSLLVKDQGRFQLADAARLYLLPDSPYYWGGVFLSARRGRQHVDLKAKVETAAPSPGGALASTGWEGGEISPEMARNVTRYMQSHSLPAALGVARNGEFKGVKRLLDVGGGSGCFSIAIAKAHPQIRCTVMELAAVGELARGYIAKAGMADRVDTATVDMFRQPWPTGYDAIFFSNIFHDWTDAMNAELAAKANSVLEPGGRICLHEILFNDAGDGPAVAAGFSMLMLMGAKGRQYTAAELAALLEGAGFVDVRTRPVYGYFSLVTGRKA